MRLGKWKYVRKTDGTRMLFDMHQMFGISEQFDVAAENPEIVERIERRLRTGSITARHVVLPGTD